MAKINSVKKKLRKVGYYRQGYVSEKLMEISINYGRKRISNKELKERYNNLGIRQYSSKKDFIDKNPNLKYKADEFWKQYKYRDELIARGQYEVARATIYRNAHIEKLETVLGVSEGSDRIINSIIYNLRNLTDNELTNLISIKSGKRGDINTILPNIGDIYKLEGTFQSNDIQELLGVDNKEFKERQSDLYEKYRNAFAMAGINWKEENNEENDDSLDPNAMPIRPLEETNEFIAKRNKTVMRYSRKHNYNISYDEYSDRINIIDKYKSKRATGLEQAFGLVQERTTNKVYGYPDTRDMRNIVLDYYKSNTKYIRTTKSGRQYIPFTKRSISDYIIKNLK